MKKVMSCLLVVIFSLLLFYGSLSYQMSFEALTIWFEKLVPSMFCIMVLVKMMFSLGILEVLAKPLTPLCDFLFHIDKQGAAYLLATIFLGFPAGADFINTQVEQAYLSKEAGRRLIYTCSFATPGFVIMTCGAVLFQSTTIGVQLFLIQILSGLLLLFLTRHHHIHVNRSTVPSLSMMHALRNAMFQSGTTLYMIGGYLLLCMSISAILTQYLPMFLQLPIRIIAEFSSGSILLCTLPYPPKILLMFLSMLLSFGGFCVHMQVVSMAEDTQVSYPIYFLFRIAQACISFMIAWFIF